MRWLALLLLLGALLSHAAIEVHEFEDETQRQRYRSLIEELRCPKCQNQNLAGSDAPIAQDLRRELTRLLKEGRSDREILDFMVQRYGDFVLYRPPFNAETALLWSAPALLLLIGGIAVAVLIRRQRRPEEPDRPLSSVELERARQLLDEESQR